MSMQNHDRPTRREFLRRSAATAAAVAGLPLAGQLALAAPGDGLLPAPPPEANPAAGSRLLSVVNPVVVRGHTISLKFLTRMFATGLTRFAGADTEKHAWQSIIKPDEKVLIKFNRSGADGLASTEAMLEVLLGSLDKAGFSRENLMLLDVSVSLQREAKTANPLLGFEDEPVEVLGRREHLHQAVAWADAIINVPFVKDHHLAGVTCAMKNLSHGLIKRPAQWHDDNCRQAIPHLYAIPAIRDKVRLHIANALRIVVDGGPAARVENVVPNNRLLFGTDPVAMDAFAARLINTERGVRGLKDLAEADRPPRYLTVARQMDLGQPDLDRVTITEMEV